MNAPLIAVVIPCYRVGQHVIDVISRIGPECHLIFAVDDACPEGSGNLIKAQVTDPRVSVIFHAHNKGVGGAMITGYRAALRAGADVVVKVDGDGQMDPVLIPAFIRPIVRGVADYTKGNRFHSLYAVQEMPLLRLFGNSMLSFITKLSSGYWRVFDPTNGYTAIHAAALRQIELRNLNERYFFESDMLINLGGVRAVVMDVPMMASYGVEISNLHVRDVVGVFLRKHIREFVKRIVYSYFLRDFNMASLELFVGILLMAFGTGFGAYHWYLSIKTLAISSPGTVLLATLPIILGFQLILAFLGYDVANQPLHPLQHAIMSDIESDGSKQRQ
jgi:glycosyltransferase involved in cell wall biosynthesis